MKNENLYNVAKYLPFDVQMKVFSKDCKDLKIYLTLTKRGRFNEMSVNEIVLIILELLEYNKISILELVMKEINVYKRKNIVLEFLNNEPEYFGKVYEIMQKVELENFQKDFCKLKLN